MLHNVKQHFDEGLRISVEVRDKIQARWNVVYYAADALETALEREFGGEAPADEAPTPRVASNVINLEERREQQILREHREQSAQEQELEIIRANVRREAA